jgi:hypothetical protein
MIRITKWPASLTQSAIPPYGRFNIHQIRPSEADACAFLAQPEGGEATVRGVVRAVFASRAVAPARACFSCIPHLRPSAASFTRRPAIPSPTQGMGVLERRGFIPSRRDARRMINLHGLRRLVWTIASNR